MSALIKKLSILLSDTYALYLKTQNYHWHVKGPQFKSCHELFEDQYEELGEAIDIIAERIRSLGFTAPATFKEFMALMRLKEGNSSYSAQEMLKDLAKDHDTLITDLYASIELAKETNDEGSANLLAERIEAHEKARWMLRASVE